MLCKEQKPNHNSSHRCGYVTMSKVNEVVQIKEGTGLVFEVRKGRN